MPSIKLNRRQKARQVKFEEMLSDFSCTKKEDIVYLIYYSQKKYIIYIDSENELHWETTKAYEEKGNKMVIEAIVAINSLKHKPTVTQFDSHSRFLFNCILGNVLVAAFGSKRPEYESALKDVEDYLSKKELETTRVWYVQYSLTILFILTALYFILLGFTLQTDSAADILRIYQYLYWGSIGSAFSILQSADKISYTCSAGKRLVFMEILCKFVISMISAVIIMAAYDIRLIFSGFVSGSNEPVFKMLLCIIAGLSEKLVPSLVERLEKAEQTPSDERNSAALKEKSDDSDVTAQSLES